MSTEAQLKSQAMSIRRPNWRLIAYWFFTVLVAQENLAGFFWGWLHLDYITVLLSHLGYPPYFGNIVGTGQLACAVVLLVPRFAVVKEWAYTGAFINYASALASHLIVGDRPDIWGFALIMLVLLVASWALRPPDRRPEATPLIGEIRATSWIAPVLILAVMTVAALLTLPKAPPQF